MCRIEVAEPWVAALDGVEAIQRMEVLYWLHLARRDLIRQSPSRNGTTRATFAIRSPDPAEPDRNVDRVVVERRGAALLVRGLDCVDGTPLLDLKPDRSEYARG